MVRVAMQILLVCAFVLSPLSVRPASAVDVNITLIAKDIGWHVGTDASTQTTIVVTVGDRLVLQIRNDDGFSHTFTAPQFPAEAGQGGSGSFLNLTLLPAQIRFWNHTVTSADEGNWQYYCDPHSSGTYPNRALMVGVLSFRQPTPPRTPGFEVVAVIAAIATAFLLVRVRRRP